MTEQTVRFTGGVADGRNLVVGALEHNPDEVVEVRLTADGEVWHIGHPYDLADEGVQVSRYRYDEATGTYVGVDE